MSGIRAVAETIRAYVPAVYATICNRTRCGTRRLCETEVPPVYAGMVPILQTPTVTLALTELPGGPADPRQVYDTAFDNPSYTLHIIGEDMVRLDTVAQGIRAGADLKAHIDTEYGIINTLSVGPPRRVVRSDRPRYEVQMQVDAEIVRNPIAEEPDSQDTITITEE